MEEIEKKYFVVILEETRDKKINLTINNICTNNNESFAYFKNCYEFCKCDKVINGTTRIKISDTSTITVFRKSVDCKLIGNKNAEKFNYCLMYGKNYIDGYFCEIIGCSNNEPYTKAIKAEICTDYDMSTDISQFYAQDKTNNEEFYFKLMEV